MNLIEWMKSAPPAARVQAIARMLSAQRPNVTTEAQLVDVIVGVLTDCKLEPLREVILTPTERVDLMVADIVIEVKVGGQSSEALRQVNRYAKHPSVGGIVLATNRMTIFSRASTMPSVAGKPMAACLLRAWP